MIERSQAEVVRRSRINMYLCCQGNKMNNAVVNIFALVAVAGILVGCGVGQVAKPESVSNKTWRLTSINGTLPTDMPRVTIEFKPISAEQGRVSGDAPCNYYFGGYKYKARGKTLSFTPMGSTMKTCPEPAMQQERDYLVGLERIKHMSMGNSTLVLKDDKGAMSLTYEVEEAEEVRKKGETARGGSPVTIK